MRESAKHARRGTGKSRAMNGEATCGSGILPEWVNRRIEIAAELAELELQLEELDAAEAALTDAQGGASERELGDVVLEHSQAK
jgi:hypothetical protein